MIRPGRILLTTLVGLGLALPFAARAQTAPPPGFGKDQRRPTGAPFALPSGLEVAGPIVGADDDGNCPGRSTEDAGSGLWVRVCVPVRNRTGGPVTTIFPPGLVIVSASEGFQNGLLIERSVITVPPHVIGGPGRLRDKDEETDIVHIPMHLYCINGPEEPSVPGAPYEMGPVTSHAGLSELYGLMADKDIAGDGERVEVLQEVVYEIIRNGRMTDEDRAAIAGL